MWLFGAKILALNSWNTQTYTKGQKMDIEEMQKQIYQNKIDKGFDIRDCKENIYKQFNFISGEVAEAFEAYHKGLGTVGEELADVAIYIMGLCEILNISLKDEIEKKMEINKNRVYKNVNGAMIKEEKKN